jgi:hypothetical protein
MSVEYPHLEYLTAEPLWRRTQAALDGRDAILRDADLYLPRTEAHKRDPDSYHLYCNRANWFAGASKTLDAWTGTICRKPLSVQVPYSYSWRIQNIDNEWTTLDGLARRVVRELCAFGRIGLLVDSNNQGLWNVEHGLPYIVPFSALQIINWRTRRTARGRALDQVVLKTAREDVHPSGYGVQFTLAYKILELDEEGLYRSREVTISDGRAIEWPAVYPTRGGQPFDAIPFYIAGPTGVSLNVQKAPLLDVVDSNINHFQLSADMASSLYWSASPTAVIIGLGPDDKDRYPVGAGSLWKLPAGADAKYLEFAGPGLAAIRDELRARKEEIALLGSSALSVPRREVETAEALQIRSSGESASLVTISDAASQVLTQALTFACHWSYSEGPVSAALSRDLVNARLSPEDIKALIFAYQSGVMTLDNLLYCFSQGEIMMPGISIEDTKAMLQTQGPLLSPGIGAPPTARATQTTRRDRSARRQLPTDVKTEAKQGTSGND